MMPLKRHNKQQFLRRLTTTHCSTILSLGSSSTHKCNTTKIVNVMGHLYLVILHLASSTITPTRVAVATCTLFRAHIRGRMLRYQL
jgi:hypothetical protein